MKMKLSLTVGTLALFLFLSLINIQPLYAATLVLQDGLNGYSGTQDTYIEEQSAKQHKDRATDNFLYARKKTGQDEHILIYFDLTSLPPYSSLISFDSALLSLYKPAGDQKDYFITAYRITNGPWQEGDGSDSTNDHADWVHRIHSASSWNTAGLGSSDYDTGSGVTTTINSNKTWYDWDVSTIVDSWWSGTNTNYGFLLTGSGDEGERKFDSSERTNRPKLTIDYTPIPEPTSMALLGAGLFGLLGARLRRKRK